MQLISFVLVILCICYKIPCLTCDHQGALFRDPDFDDIRFKQLFHCPPAPPPPPCSSRSPHDEVCMKTYAVYLMGFTMFIMMVAIISLSVRLYLSVHNKAIPGFHLLKSNTYVRQESNNITLHSVNTIGNEYSDESKITANNENLEVKRISNPETSLHTSSTNLRYVDSHTSGEQGLLRINRKKPGTPDVLIMPQFQMAELVEAVLRKNKSDSTTLRELQDMVQKNQDRSEVDSKIQNDTKLKDVTVKINDKELIITNDRHLNDADNQEIYMNSDTIKKSTTHKTVECDKKSQNYESDEGNYDTLPKPRSGQTSPNCDIPFYDLLPTKKKGVNANNLVVTDQDSEYLLPLSRNGSGKLDYVNANLFNKSQLKTDDIGMEIYDTIETVPTGVKENAAITDNSRQDLLQFETKNDNSAIYMNARLI